MAKTSKRVAALRKPKFRVRQHNRCRKCGRSKAYLRKFACCRICFRDLALRGQLAGVIKASW